MFINTYVSILKNIIAGIKRVYVRNKNSEVNRVACVLPKFLSLVKSKENKYECLGRCHSTLPPTTRKATSTSENNCNTFDLQGTSLPLHDLLCT